MSAFLKQFLPGPKGLATMVVGAILWLDHHFKWNIPDIKIRWGVGLVATWMMTHEDFLVKLFAAIRGAKAPVSMALAALALGLGGCSLTPMQIQTDTAIATNLGLNGAVIFDKVKAPEIQADAVQVAQAINAVVIPTFQVGATSGALLNSTVSQAMLHLQARLAGLKHGSEILGMISLLQAPLAGALGSTASPTALLPAASQAKALAFFTGVSQGIATFTGNQSLAPPAPPAPTPPPAPPAPAPTPVPPK